MKIHQKADRAGLFGRKGTQESHDIKVLPEFIKSQHASLVEQV
jgi:hypothetical protein